MSAWAASAASGVRAWALWQAIVRCGFNLSPRFSKLLGRHTRSRGVGARGPGTGAGRCSRGRRFFRALVDGFPAKGVAACGV